MGESRVKILKIRNEEVESDLKFPIYLYFQDELCNDEYVKITKDTRTTITSTIYGVEIKVDKSYGRINEYEENFVTKKEFYDEHLAWAMKVISQ